MEYLIFSMLGESIISSLYHMYFLNNEGMSGRYQQMKEHWRQNESLRGLSGVIWFRNFRFGMQGLRYAHSPESTIMGARWLCIVVVVLVIS